MRLGALLGSFPVCRSWCSHETRRFKKGFAFWRARSEVDNYYLAMFADLPRMGEVAEGGIVFATSFGGIKEQEVEIEVASQPKVNCGTRKERHIKWNYTQRNVFNVHAPYVRTPNNTTVIRIHGGSFWGYCGLVKYCEKHILQL